MSKKYSPKKLISRHNEQPKTLTRQEYKGKIYVKNIRKNHVGFETGSGFGSETNRKVGSGSGSEKNHSGSTTLLLNPRVWPYYMQQLAAESTAANMQLGPLPFVVMDTCSQTLYFPETRGFREWTLSTGFL